MHVLIAEPKSYGHRLNQVGILLDAVRALPAATRVTVALAPGAVVTAEFAQWIAPRIAGTSVVEILPAPVATHRPAWILGAASAIADAAAHIGADHVLVPGGDGVVQMAAAGRFTGRFPRRRGVEFEAMMLRGKFAYDRAPSLRDRVGHAAWFAAVRLSPFDRIHHMDPLIYETAVARQPSIARKLRQIPDPVDPIEADLTIAEARAKLALPPAGRMLGCVGGLQLRKGIDLLIRSFARKVTAGRLRDDDRLLLVGVPEKGVDAILDGEAKALVETGRIVAIRRFVSDVEMSNAISAMNLVVTAYPGHVGSASITLRAAAQRRPVLADRFGWCGRVVPLFGLGTIVDVTDANAFDAAMIAALDATGDFVPDPRADRLVRYGAVSNFQAHWMERLRQRLSLPSESKFTWAEAIAGR